LIIANDISSPDTGFASEDNKVTILEEDGSGIELPKSSKQEIASGIWNRIEELLKED